MSKILSIMRHASSSSGNIMTPDIERFVLPDGVRQTEYIAGKMIENDLLPDMLWVSPAQRARETAMIVAKALNLDCKMELHPSLYHDDDELVLDEIAECNDDIRHLMIVGHNPLVTQITCQMSGTGGFGWFGTSNLVSLEFDTENWSEAQRAKIISKLKLTPIEK